MYLPPTYYKRLVRPQFGVKKYIEDVIAPHIDLSTKKVLDFGCGTGDLAYLCASEGYLGVDVDQGRVAFAAKENPEYQFAHIDDDLLIPTNQTFDVILAVAVLHHISDAQVAVYLPQLQHLLNPGGKIIGIEPCKYEKPAFSNWYMDRVDNGEYIRSESEYFNLLQPHFTLKPLKRFRKFVFYRELFYEAAPAK